MAFGFGDGFVLFGGVYLSNLIQSKNKKHE